MSEKITSPTPQSGPMLVAGSGPVGLVAALALANGEVPVLLVGPEPAGDDRRTTALMAPSLAMLEKLDLGDRLRGVGTSLQTLRIVDATNRLMRAPAVTFRASEVGESAFGLNVPNADLLAVLKQAILSSGSIQWLRTTVERWHVGDDSVAAVMADGSRHTTSLVVAADGRASPARAAAGIDTSTRNLDQAALVLNFTHARSHENISTEFHTESGPFTQVPLRDRRSSLVWVVTPGRAEELASMDDAALSRQIEDGMGSMLGRVVVEPGRQVYPLATIRASRVAKHRVMLVGEAAHVFPPIGAQGLNLGIRDVDDLVATVVRHPGDPGGAEAISAYERLRRRDVFLRSAGVDLLNRSLLSDFLPVQLARTAGLSLLAGMSPVRAFMMREGLRSGSGFRGLLADLRKQIRR